MRFASSLGLLTAVLSLATPANSAFERAQFAAPVVPGAPALTHTVVALRGGAWWDPYEPTAANDPTDLLYSATLPGGDDVVHYTVGGGIVLSNNIEVNGGADWSKRTTAITVSAVVRF